jgi:putative adhesin
MKGMPAMTEFSSTGLRHSRLSTLGAAFVSALMLSSLTATAQVTKEPGPKETRLEIAPGGTVNIFNNAGSVNLKSGSGRQVLVAYSLHSNKVEVDQESTADKKRIEIRTHALADQNPTADEAKVDYDITIPAGISVSVSTATAPITADGVSGDITLSSDTGPITAANVARSHLHVRSVVGAVNLNSVTLGHVDVTSSGGTVQLVNVTGPKVNVGTANGSITYQGDCSGGGDYLMTTHTGSIDMTLPETASVDLMAHSVSGTVQNDFPLQARKHSSFVPKSGSSFAGTSNSGSSSVELRSISGRIRVKKQ